MELPANQFKRMLPLPVTVITTIDGEGIANAAPYGCVMPILRPLDLIAIASALPRHTLQNIRKTREFVVNVIGIPSFAKAMATAGNYPPEVDELEAVGIERISARMVRPPRIRDALGWIEAVLEREITGENYALIIGKVLCAEKNDTYAGEESFQETSLVMLDFRYRRVGESIGDLGETLKLFGAERASDE